MRLQNIQTWPQDIQRIDQFDYNHFAYIYNFSPRYYSDSIENAFYPATGVIEICYSLIEKPCALEAKLNKKIVTKGQNSHVILDIEKKVLILIGTNQN